MLQNIYGRTLFFFIFSQYLSTSFKIESRKITEARQYTTVTAKSNSKGVYKQRIDEQNGIKETIIALDYVSADHPLLPPLRSRSIDSVMSVRNRVRYHAEFW
jgi:hypothetical protein